ncbi:MAG: hypothetical protein HKN91_03620 [Acidimicrobiia bacterium]|nr:hypothetical protein [Acidimicrobiia bacterium]
MQRIVLGIIALVLVVGGALGAFTEVFGANTEWWGGVALRTGLVLGAFWLVMPRAKDVPTPVWVGLGVFAVVLAARPRLVLFGLVIAFIAMVVTALAQRRSSANT